MRLRKRCIWGAVCLYVFGRDDSYWYRLYQSLGRFSIVGTTVKDPASMPLHLADEKHSWRLGERVFIPQRLVQAVFWGGYRWKC